jgi:ABC-type transporter Mla MlaB component
MIIRMTGTVGHLQGDLTHSGVSRRCIDSLSVSLRQMETGGAKNISIDCGRIRKADISGLRLLYVWMQCARFSGLELELVNLSDGLQQVMRSFGLVHGFTGPMERGPLQIIGKSP